MQQKADHSNLALSREASPRPTGLRGRKYVSRPRSISTPLSSYLLQRATKPYSSSQSERARMNFKHKEALDRVASTKAEPGLVGGFFNATTQYKSFPLNEASPYLVGTSSTKTVRLHSNRFLPHIRLRAVSDSSLDHRPSNQMASQSERLSACEDKHDQKRLLKEILREPPHRLNLSYYLQGQVAPAREKEGGSLKDQRAAPKRDLYYGRGLKLSKFPVKLTNSAQRNEANDVPVDLNTFMTEN